MEASLAEDIKNLVITSCVEIRNKDLHDEIETKNIELEYRVASLIKENEHLKLTYKNLFDSIKKSRVQTKTSNVTQNEAENLKSQLFEFAETKFSNILEKIEFFKKSPGEKQHLFENKTSVFQIKIDELEKVLTQQTKDFNAVKLELSNRTAKFEAYFEKLEKTKVVLERQLARKVDDSKAEKDQFLKEINHLRTQLENLKGKSVKTKFDKHSILGKPPADKLLINSQISKSWFTPKVDMQKSLSKPVTAQSLPKNEKDQLLKRIAYLESKLASQDIRSCQKEYHELRTLYNALKVKFDSLNRKRRETNVSKSSKPRESVSAKVHTGESSKPFSRRVSQFTTYSLQKDRKFSKNSQSFETLTPQKGFKKRASNAKHQSFETTYSCFTPVKQVWRPIKESQTFEASTSQKSFKTRTLKGKNQVFDPHSHFTPVNQGEANSVYTSYIVLSASNGKIKAGALIFVLVGNILANHRAVIVCDEKIVRIPYGYDVLIVQVTKKETEDKLEEKRLEDISTVQDFLEVFPEDLPRLPPMQQVEFQIDLVPSAAPVARAPYRLAPLKLQELPTQLYFEDYYSEDQYSVSIKEDMVYPFLHSPKTTEDKAQYAVSKETQYAIFKIWNKYNILEDIKRGFSKIAKPITKLTQKNVKYDWSVKAKAAFQLLKQKLCSAPILALPEGSENFVVYCDASRKGLGAILMQREKVIAYALRQLKIHEKNYVRLDNQFIERDRLIGIGFMLDFVEFISSTFGDKEMISVIEAVSR
ncbi:putative reverse transcriptase domain-containing protein [Tanacetum coccineum]|uniref:Reverse transcriptase domain-containing protein n=1 Tax=Tanacetum coccineum TaxID=301880 RepID=A0ABQ4ZJ59_9ASTR